MKNLNVTQILLMTLLGIVSLWGVRQCSTSNLSKKEVSSLRFANQELQKEIILSSKYSDSLSTLAYSLAEQTSTLEQDKRDISRAYRRSKDKLREMSADSLYVAYIGLYTLIGHTYLIDSTLLLEAETNKIDLIECKEIKHIQKTENEMLNDYISEVISINNNLIKEFNECELERVTLEGRLDEGDLERKDLKRKVWTNRGVAVGLTVLMIMLL